MNWVGDTWFNLEQNCLMRKYITSVHLAIVSFKGSSVALSDNQCNYHRLTAKSGKTYKALLNCECLDLPSVQKNIMNFGSLLSFQKGVPSGL